MCSQSSSEAQRVHEWYSGVLLYAICKCRTFVFRSPESKIVLVSASRYLASHRDCTRYLQYTISPTVILECPMFRKREPALPGPSDYVPSMHVMWNLVQLLRDWDLPFRLHHTRALSLRSLYSCSAAVCVQIQLLRIPGVVLPSCDWCVCIYTEGWKCKPEVHCV